MRRLAAQEDAQRSHLRESFTVDPIDAGDVADGDTILDVRRAVHGAQPRGALRYDPKVLRTARRISLPLDRDGRIVLLPDSQDDTVAIAAQLRDMGFGRVRVLRGGIEGWRAAGRPTERPAVEQPVPEFDSSPPPL